MSGVPSKVLAKLVDKSRRSFYGFEWSIETKNSAVTLRLQKPFWKRLRKPELRLFCEFIAIEDLPKGTSFVCVLNGKIFYEHV